MQVDYLIVGQGICGTFLSYFLQRAGQRVMVIDDDKPSTASKVASGVINPVTGRRIVRTWRIETLLPFAQTAYRQLGEELGKALVQQLDVLDFHPSLQMKEAFEKRLPEETEYLHPVDDDTAWKNTFNFHFGVGSISPCLLVDLSTLLAEWRQQLLQANSLLLQNFQWKDCLFVGDSVSYHGISAGKVIFCDGVGGTDHPLFKNLPYALNKGEALIVEIPGLPQQHIYKQGLTLVPWRDGLFWVGSSYEWNFSDDQPSASFREKTAAQLKFWLRLPFRIVDHAAAVRPANMERRPFAGLHPENHAVGLLNGMGTKGCSLAPFYAHQLSQHLVDGTPLHPDANVKRFEKVLKRKLN